MKAVSLLINSYLPEDLRDYNRTYTAKELNELMSQVADKYPDQFDNILRRVSDTGRKAAYYQGETITLADLASPIDKKALFAQMDAEIDALPKDKDFKTNRRAIFQKYNQLMEKLTADAALKNRNNISMAVLSGARGKSPQLKAMVTSPGTYSDYKGEPIDVFSKESFAEGINPTTFAASSYGTRASVISTKCLAGDTLVVMADGSEKEIRNIKTGEIVLGADVAGKLHAVAVCNVFDQGEKPCFEYRWEYKKPVPVRKDIWMSPSITTRTYETIKVVCTQDHKFLCADGEVKPPVTGEDSSVKEASFWAMSLGRRAVFLGREYVGPVHCYDIEVDHPDHLFVLANGLITSNSSTAKGGDWAKQMAQVAADMVVRKEDCGSHNGLSLDIDDSSLKGRVLAQDAGPVKAGTLLTKDVINALRKQGIKKVEARSTLTCGVHNGVCSKCIGKYYNGGKWAKVGQHVGVAASSALAEPVTQMALCLSGDTKVPCCLETGNRFAYMELKDIEPGMRVVGCDRQGQKSVATVLNKFVRGRKSVRDYYIEIYPVYADAEEEHTFVPQIYSTELKVRCTADHKFLCADGEIRPIGECLEDSHVVLTNNGDGIVESASEPIMEECYDIEIDHPDHLFLLANGLITSNSAKHTAGMTQTKRTYSGLDVIQQFTQSPEKFKDEGTVATLDGKVDRVEEAPQGGMYVTVKGKKHYILPGHAVEVQEGDTVEAGDQLAEGLVDPEDIVKYKGLGEGRKYWADRLNKILADSGAASDKRNTELMARAAIRHVRVTDQDGMGDYLPDDVVDYNALQASYKPSETTRRVRTKEAVGSYLQTPVMHYTIGTRITPKVAKELQDNGHNEVDVDDKEPGFTPEMIRLRTASHSNPDWLASMGTSYLTKQLNEASVRGDDTNVLNNPDWRPRLAYGAGFGKDIEATGEF